MERSDAGSQPFHSPDSGRQISEEKFNDESFSLLFNIYVTGLLKEAQIYEEKFDDEDLELKVEQALDCPCVADLREGPCGKEFSKAFVCFIKSTAEHKGSDCVESFLNMQACMLEYPDAFSRHESRDISEEQRGDVASPETPVPMGQ